MYHLLLNFIFGNEETEGYAKPDEKREKYLKIAN